MTVPALPLDDLSSRHVGVTIAIAAVYREAASVCFERHHRAPQLVEIDNDTEVIEAEAGWVQPDERTRQAWANEIDTTEAGAYAVILASSELARGVFAIRRAETGTGSDYYVGPAGSGVEDLEDCQRLEVSGTDSLEISELARRVSKKVEQVRKGEGSLPALVGVVGFPAKKIVLRSVV